jgi:hypothetical protein
MDRTDILKAYFLFNSKYYLDKFEKFENGKKISFNFWAGFFGIMWFVYRKMYKQAVIIFFLTFALELISAIIIAIILYLNSIEFDKSYISIINYIIYAISFVLLGFVGNFYYFRKAKTIVNGYIINTDLTNLTSSDLNIIRNRGGVDMKNAIILAVVLSAISIIVKIVN